MPPQHRVGTCSDSQGDTPVGKMHEGVLNLAIVSSYNTGIATAACSLM